MTSVVWNPLIPWSFLLGLALAGLALWGVSAWRRARGHGWRLLVLAALLAGLANPRLEVEQRRLLPDVALVVVDETQSQGIGQRRAQTEAALTDLQAKLAQWPNLEVRVAHIAGGEDGTRLFAAAERALADLPRRRLAGLVMITDGLVHDVPADLGHSLGAPVHSLLTGRPGERDRRLVVLAAPSYALVGHAASVRFKVEDPGATGEAQVEIRVDGAPYLAAQIPLNRETAIDVPVRHAGQIVVELEAAPGPNELSLANNRAAFGISGVRDRLKVLLLSGEPHPGERTWRNLLKADPAVDLVHFTILRPPDKDDATPIRELSLITFPVRELFEDKLSQFDLVIFDRFRRRNVLSAAYYQALADYVERGGALLAALGPEFAEPGGLYETPLGRVLPAGPEGGMLAQPFRPSVTELGRRHPVTSGLPDSAHWGRWLRQVAVRQNSGETLLAGIDGRPLVILDQVGQGRVAEVLSDTIWLWARGWEGGGPHDELLRRLAHWLMKEPELEAEALKAEISGDHLRITRRSLNAAPVEVTITRPDGTTLSAPLADQGDGRATLSLAADQPGLWRVTDGHRAAIAAAGNPAPLEMADLAATPDRLAPVATATGGSVRWLAEGGVPEIRRVGAGSVAEGRGWIGLANRGEAVVTGLTERPALPGWVWLLLAGGGLVLAWVREGE